MFKDDLQTLIEQEERLSVGASFGGTLAAQKNSFSVTSIRNWLLEQLEAPDQDPALIATREIIRITGSRVGSTILTNALRFSFLIELTNLKVGSTRMKTRWLPGLILMPQANSFQPVRGSFEPGNDPRSATYDQCYDVFKYVLETSLTKIVEEPTVIDFFSALKKKTRVPYEAPFSYADHTLDMLHTDGNIRWILNDDIRWLVKARNILSGVAEEHKEVIKKIENTKLKVKVYLTDRALTGKDKTNRAKRWEVLAGDFQHATLEECWSVEKKLTEGLIKFRNFPTATVEKMVSEGLIDPDFDSTKCPVTLAPLDFIEFSQAVIDMQHGRSDYQVGHLHPLKRNGRHIGENVCWQSADGNRIQGDLSLDETKALLSGIRAREDLEQV